FIQHNGNFHIYAFDCILADGTNMSELKYEVRLLSLPESVEIVNRYMTGSNTCSMKNIAHTGSEYNEAKRIITEVYEKEYPYNIDGLIFIRHSEDNTYRTTTNYKWKPLKNTTIDFLAAKCPQKLLGIKPYLKKPGYDLYLLFVGIQ